MKGDLMNSMRWTLLFGKYTGLMPLVGLGLSGGIDRFTWKSGWVLMYVSYLIIQTFVFVIEIYNFFDSRLEVNKTNAIVIFAVYLITSLLVLRFCYKCKDFVTSVQALEKLLPPLWKPRSSVSHINKFMGVLLLFGLGEHVSYLLYSYLMTLQCYKISGDSGLYMKSYFMLVFSWYFKYFSFSYISAAVFQIVKTQASIMWFYLDLLIMVYCIYLKNRFEEFNRLILNKESMFTKYFKPSWSELQVHYTRISKLVFLVDSNINAIVFVSYTSNLYHICMITYFMLNKLTGLSHIEATECGAQHSNDAIPVFLKTYNAASLVIRTIILSYLATEVHKASRKSLNVLHTIPSSACNADMRRLITQVYYSKLGVSGLNFFQITRGMMLTMVTRILTYELVLFQL